MIGEKRGHRPRLYCYTCKPARNRHIKTFVKHISPKGMRAREGEAPLPLAHDPGGAIVKDRDLSTLGAPPQERLSIEYRPHPKQEIFSRAIERGAKIVFFLAGIRSGKTLACAFETLKHLYMYDRSPNLFYMVSPTNNMARVPIRAFQNAAGNALVHYKRSSDQGPAHFLMRPSLSIPDYYYIIEQHSGEHPERMKGETVSGAWMDECQQMKPEVLDVLRGRVMESDGIIFLSGTATYPGHWTKTEIVDKAYLCGRCGVCVYDHYDLVDNERRIYGPKDHEPVDCTGDPRIAVIICSTFDNTHIPKKQIEQLRKDYSLKDPLIARRELYAEYTGFEGLVYTHFDREIHKSEYTMATVPPDSHVVCGIDFGVNDPFVCVFLARVKDTWHVVGEYYTEERGVSLKEHAQRIRAYAGKRFNMIRTFWYDPSGKQAAYELQRYGLRPMLGARKRKSIGQTWKMYRYEVVLSHMMARNEKDLPMLRFSPAAARTIHDFESRKWKRYVSSGEDGVSRVIDLKGHNVDRNAGDDFAPGFDHGTDAVEYALASEFVKGLYKLHSTTKKDGEEVESPLTGKPKVSPETMNLAHYLGASLEEKRKKLFGGKFRVERFNSPY